LSLVLHRNCEHIVLRDSHSSGGARLKPSRYTWGTTWLQLWSRTQLWRRTQLWSRTLVLPASIATLILGAAAPAFAQRANGPYSGLFGGQDTTNQSQGLNLNLGLFGEYDKNEFPADQTDLIDPRLREDGASVGVMGSLQYQRNGDFGRFTWSGGGTSQDYSASPGLVSASNTSATLSWNMRPKLVFDARASAGYSPFFQFSPFQSGGTMATGPSLSGFGFAAVA